MQYLINEQGEKTGVVLTMDEWHVREVKTQSENVHPKRILTKVDLECIKGTITPERADAMNKALRDQRQAGR